MKDSVQKLIFLLCSVHAVNQDKCGMFLFSVQATEPQTLRTSNVLWLRREETQREYSYVIPTIRAMGILRKDVTDT